MTVVLEHLRFKVYGEPSSQGSVRAYSGKDGVARVRQGGSARRQVKLADWRHAVAEAARQAQGDAERPLIDGACYLTISFLLPKPKSAPRWKHWVTTTPDVSKLLRAVEDALTGVLVTDDKKFVSVTASKAYAIDCPPHADILITVVDERATFEIAPVAAKSDQPALI